MKNVYVLTRTPRIYETVCTSLPVHTYIYSKGEMKNVYVLTRAPLVYIRVCTSLAVHSDHYDVAATPRIPLHCMAVHPYIYTT